MKLRVICQATVIGLVISLMNVGATENANAKTFRLVIGAGHAAAAAIWTGTMKDFFAPEVKKRVAARTGHQINWVDAYGGSVAKLGEELEAVQDGLLDVGFTLPIFEPNKLFLHNFCFYVPFASGDTLQVSRILVNLYNEIPFLKGVFEKEYNQKLLGVATGNSFDLITTFPWQKVSELAGHKIGGGGANLPWIKAIPGVVTVQMNYNEAYTSLQTGVYEGVLGGPDGALGFRLYEVAKTYTICGLGCNVMGMIVINLDTWKRLPPEIQAIMLEVGREYAKVEAEASLAKKNLALDTMRRVGVRIHTLPFEEQVKWANMMPDLPNEKASEAEQRGMPGKDVISAYIKALDAEKYKFPRRWLVH